MYGISLLIFADNAIIAFHASRNHFVITVIGYQYTSGAQPVTSEADAETADEVLLPDIKGKQPA